MASGMDARNLSSLVQPRHPRQQSTRMEVFRRRLDKQDSPGALNLVR